MKNYIVLDGKKIPLSEETVKNLSESIKEKKYLQSIPGKDLFYCDSNGEICGFKHHTTRPLEPNESHNRRTLEKALKFIQLQNFADEVNEEFYGNKIYLAVEKDNLRTSQVSESWNDGIVYFSSEEAAQKAIDYFGEEWIKDYLK